MISVIAPLSCVVAFSSLLNIDAIDLRVAQGYVLLLKCDAHLEVTVELSVIVLFAMI